MGIKGLNPFLKKHCSEIFLEIPISYFSGKRIAIDGENLVRRFMCTAHKQIVNQTDVTSENLDRNKIHRLWISRWKRFLTSFLSNGITPIIIFDGNHPIEKKDTQKERWEKRKEKQKEADEYRIYVQNLDPLERTSKMLGELRKKMSTLSYVSHEDKLLLQNILSIVGVPYLMATGEGEKLCAMLAREGKVDAVYSKDTDLITYGTPLIITDFGNFKYNEKNGRNEEYFQCTMFDGILSSLNISYSTFIDLCIMSKCDYNENIPRLGIGRAYKLLLKHQSIDNLPKQYDDKKIVLNTNFCRKQFSYVHSSNLCTSNINLNIQKKVDIDNEIVKLFELQDWLNKINKFYFDFPMPEQNNFISKPPQGYNFVLTDSNGNKIKSSKYHKSNLKSFISNITTQNKNKNKKISSHTINSLQFEKLKNSHPELFSK